VATQVPAFIGFPLGVSSGTYDGVFNLAAASSWNPSFINAHGGTPAGAEAFVAAALADGRAYLNIHTSVVPGGEIRGFLVPVPEPALTSVVAGLGLCGLGAWRRLFRRIACATAPVC
jgi:hypothetical protein